MDMRYPGLLQVVINILFNANTYCEYLLANSWPTTPLVDIFALSMLLPLFLFEVARSYTSPRMSSAYRYLFPLISQVH
jgi:hypothetical protein